MFFLCDFPDKRKSMQFKWVPTTFAFKKYTCCNLKTTELLDYALTGVCAVIRSNMVFSLLWPSVFLVIFRRFAPNSSFVLRDYHTCHKLWTEICEVCPIFKGDLIKICESLTKITLKLYQNSQKPLFKWTKLGLGGSVGCAVRQRPGGRGFNPHRGWQNSFMEIDHEIFSTVILFLPLIQEGQLSVSGERMCTILVNSLED